MLNLSAFKLQNPSLLNNLNQVSTSHSIISKPFHSTVVDRIDGSIDRSGLLADDPPRVRRSGWDLSPLAIDEGSRGNVDHTHTPQSDEFGVWFLTMGGIILFGDRIPNQRRPKPSCLRRARWSELWDYARNPSRLFLFGGGSREPLHRPCSEKGPEMKRCLFWEMRRGFLFFRPIIDTSWVINDF